MRHVHCFGPVGVRAYVTQLILRFAMLSLQFVERVAQLIAAAILVRIVHLQLERHLVLLRGDAARRTVRALVPDEARPACQGVLRLFDRRILNQQLVDVLAAALDLSDQLADECILHGQIIVIQPRLVPEHSDLLLEALLLLLLLRHLLKEICLVRQLKSILERVAHLLDAVGLLQNLGIDRFLQRPGLMLRITVQFGHAQVEVPKRMLQPLDLGVLLDDV